MNAKAIFLVLTAVICLQYATAGPLQEEVSPCDTFMGEDDTDVTLFCDKRDTTLIQIKNALNNLRDEGTIELELYQVNLGTIPSNFFEGHNIKVLTIAWCELDSLSGGGGRPLQGLENSLESLMVKGSLSHGNDFKNSALSHLRNLKELDLESNSFGEVGNDWFKRPPPSLRTIEFSGNKIDSIGDKLFAEISTLEFVFMNNNRFGPITRSMFPDPANQLYRIQLIDNELTDIPESFFSNMPSLKMVSFAENKITKLPESVWRPVWNQLSDIDLSENPLQCGSHMDWMLDEQTCAKITAKCESPEETSGQLPPQITYGDCI